MFNALEKINLVHVSWRNEEREMMVVVQCTTLYVYMPLLK